MTERHIIGGIVAGQDYEMRVRGIAGLVRGPWAASVTGTGQVDTTPPGVPGGLVAVGLIRAVALNWANPADLDLRSVEIWEAATFAGTYAKIGETGGTNFQRTGLPPGGSAWFRLRAVDRSGNLGAFTAPVQGTASLLLVDDIAQGIIDTAAFAQGIEPVGLVTTGPVPTAKTVEVIFHGPTNQLYRWDSATSAYVRLVRAADVDGLIQDSQISSLDAAKLSGAVADAQLAGIAASKITGQLTNTQIADLAAAKVTGTLVSSQIAAEAITASKLLLADTSNTYPDYDLMDDALWSGTGYALLGVNSAILGRRRLYIYANAAEVVVTGHWFQVEHLTPYWVEWTAYPASSNNTTMSVRLEWASMNGGGAPSFLSSTALVTDKTAAGASREGLNVVSPSNARRARWVVTRAAGGSADVTFGGPLIRRRASAELIVDGAVTAAKLATGAIQADAITGQVQAAQIAGLEAAKVTGQLSDAQIAALDAAKLTGTLNEDRIAALDAAKLTGAITSTQITDGAISTPKLATGAVVAASIAASAITADKISAAAVETTALAAGAITADKIAANAITAAKIEAGAITTAKLAAGAVTASEIAAGAVTAGKVAALSITSAELATHSVLATKIAASAVTAEKIATNAVTAAKIQAAAITADKIQAGAITASKLVLADTSNTYPDFDMEDAGFYASSLGSAYGFVGTTAGPLGRRYLQITASSVAATVEAGWFPVEANADYLAQGGAWLSTASSTVATLEVEFGTMTATGAVTPTRRVLLGANSAAYNATSSLFRTAIVTSATERRARFVMSKSDVATAAARFGGFILRRRANASLIVEGAITASKLLLADTSNTYPDYDLMDDALWAGTGHVLEGVNSSALGRRRMRILAQAAEVMVTGHWFQVETSTPYWVVCTAYPASTNNAAVTVALEWASMTSNGATTFISASTIVTDKTAASASREGLDVVSPSTARRARWVVTRAAGGSADVTFGGPLVRRRASAELIVDGAVIADKIAANAVVADKIAANAVTAEKISAGAVETAKIAAGAIEADQLAAGAVTTGKLAVAPPSGNVIWNSCLPHDRAGWSVGGTAVPTFWGATGTQVASTDWRLRGQGSGGFNVPAGVPAGGFADMYWNPDGEFVPVVEGEWWEFQALTQRHRCSVELKLGWYNAAGTYITETSLATAAPSLRRAG